jgi:hypothetical protein
VHGHTGAVVTCGEWLAKVGCVGNAAFSPGPLPLCDRGGRERPRLSKLLGDDGPGSFGVPAFPVE